MAGLRNSAMPLYKRALKQPENVKKVLAMMREQGLQRTHDRVMGRLQAGTPTGYSAAGIVTAVGECVDGFQVGDRVACAGAGIAYHAEWIDVPVNLAVKIPDALDFNLASTVTLGSIAMQGVRRAQPQLGETFVVVGLGVLGQITAQLLCANGCRVLGVDPDQTRVDRALSNGMQHGLNPVVDEYVASVTALTDGFGADGVIITAASSGSQIVQEAMQCCRKKGRVILVGDVGLDLNRADFYKKELDFLISCSYGPGRYDPNYEEGGQDYPLPYVRWTENRNMEAYLQLLSSGRLTLQNLIGGVYPVDQAEQAFSSLNASGERPLFVLLSYPGDPHQAPARLVTVNSSPAKSGPIRLALIGAGGFAQGMHLPNVLKLRDQYELRAVMSRTGANAKAVAQQYGAAYATTDFDAVLQDPNVDLVLIATRHNVHAGMTLRALKAGKHVFVEKPLATTPEDMAGLEDFYRANPNRPVLMTGFNRRFAPVITKLIHYLRSRTTPLIVNYRMNAGFIPVDHWVHGVEGGGRNIGEACHIYDLFSALTGSKCIDIHAMGIEPRGKHWTRTDNFVATMKYRDGSVCTLTYTAQGHRHYPKERMDLFVDGKVLSIDDYKSLNIVGAKTGGWHSRTVEKGQYEELQALANCLLTGREWPISLEDQLQATRISFEVERLLLSQRFERIAQQTESVELPSSAGN